MLSKRAVFLVSVDLDPVPGTMHTVESAKEVILSSLAYTIGHYSPVVEVVILDEPEGLDASQFATFEEYKQARNSRIDEMRAEELKRHG